MSSFGIFIAQVHPTYPQGIFIAQGHPTYPQGIFIAQVHPTYPQGIFIAQVHPTYPQGVSDSVADKQLRLPLSQTDRWSAQHDVMESFTGTRMAEYVPSYMATHWVMCVTVLVWLPTG